MNKLFSALMRGYAPVTFSWFDKHTSAITPTSKSDALVSNIIRGIPDDRRAMFASVLCNLVLNTQYGAEIIKLDPNNTYVTVTRPPIMEAAHSDPKYCMHDLIQPIQAYKDIKLYLEDDIANRLDSNSWFDLMGAACLQLLREVA